MEAIRVTQQHPRCPYCHDDITHGAFIKCKCGATHHAGCAGELGKCATCSSKEGFDSTPETQTPAPRPAVTHDAGYAPAKNAYDTENRPPARERQRRQDISLLFKLVCGGLAAFAGAGAFGLFQEKRKASELPSQLWHRNYYEQNGQKISFSYQEDGQTKSATYHAEVGKLVIEYGMHQDMLNTLLSRLPGIPERVQTIAIVDRHIDGLDATCDVCPSEEERRDNGPGSCDEVYFIERVEGVQQPTISAPHRIRYLPRDLEAKILSDYETLINAAGGQ